MQLPDVLRVPPSRVDRFLHCATSALKPERADQNPQTDAAESGRAAHEVCESVPFNLTPDIEAIAAKYGADVDDLEWIHSAAQRVWNEIGEFLPAPEVEVRINGDWGEVGVGPQGPRQNDLMMRVTGSGIPDVVSVTFALDGQVDTLGILDWKTGYARHEHPNQLLAGAVLAREKYGMPKSGVILGVEAWVRHNDRRVHHFTHDDLNGLRDRVLDRAAQVGKQIGAGSWCTFCRRELECETRSAWVRSLVSDALVDRPVIDRSVLGGAFRERLAVLEKVVAKGKALIAAELKRGPLDAGDGTVIIEDQQRQDRILYTAGAHIIADLGLSDPELDEVISVGKGKLMAAAARRAGKGEGAARKRELRGELLKAGAIVDRFKRTTRIIDRDALTTEEQDEMSELERQLRLSLEGK